MALTFTLASCDYIDIRNDKGTEKKPAPQVERFSDGVQLTIGSIPEAQYLNIFRYQAANSHNDSPVDETTAVNIGEIFIYNKDITAFSFKDKYTDSAKYYKYEIRYRTGKSYVYSELSAVTVKGTRSGSDAERQIVLTGSATRVNASYDDNQFVITIPTSSLTLPATLAQNSSAKFDVMIAVSNGTVTNLFKMTEDIANAQYTISLRSNLPAHFYDKPLTVKNIVGQYTENSPDSAVNDPDYQRVFWTKPANVQLKKNSSDISSFEIKSVLNTTDVKDYTPKASSMALRMFAENLLADPVYCDYE